MFSVPPSSQPHIYIVICSDTSSDPQAVLHDIVCLCAFNDYP